MPAYSSPSSSPPPTASRRRMRNCAHRIERVCCVLATYFPLAFVYGITTWAVWVEGSIGLGRTGSGEDHDLTASVRITSLLAVVAYLLLNTSYTVAVFTDPGSPLNGPATKSKSTRGGKYSILPTSEPGSDVNGSALPGDFQTVTVSSSGESRYCKKCQTPKPDRTHHCSTCKRCVLKMDHHCPWLATCLGHRNYKAFVLFLSYTTIFCWICFLGSGRWVYDFFAGSAYLGEEYASVNVVMLAVISGLIGLVLTGFTGWHLWLVLTGMTTIECLEKTRYMSGVRARVERNRLEQHRRGPSSHGQSEELMDRVRRAGDQILEFHANAVPGASRYEEGEERMSPTPSTVPIATSQPQYNGAEPLYHDHPPAANADMDSPAQRALRGAYQQSQAPRPPPGRFNYRLGVHEYENARDQERYNEYLQDKEDEKLPNAFDLGWRRNFRAVFGEDWWAWFLPIMNSPGDGWRWEVSEKWRQKKHESDLRRAERLFQQQQQQNFGYDGSYDSQHSQQNFPVRGPGDNRQYAEAQNHGDYSRSATSLSTLTPHGQIPQPPRGRAWGGRFKKDIDTSGEDGEHAEFEVSGDSADEAGSDDQRGAAAALPRSSKQDTWDREWD